MVNDKVIQVPLTEMQINNILVFLDKGTYTGLKETSAVQEIVQTLLKSVNNRTMEVQENG